MKKIVIILISLVTLQVTAQEKKKELHKEGQSERMESLTPEEIATLQTKKMTLHLDLTEEQQKKIQALHLDEAKMRKAKMEERKAMKESGEKKAFTKEDKVKMMNERLDHQIATKQKMKSILNAEQYAKWEASMGKMEQRRDGKKKMMKHKKSEEKQKQ